MSPITFRKAERANIGLLIMLAGGTGSGKSWSSMALAKGLAGGARFAFCDTERGRASMYADTFDFDVFDLEPPFGPDRYQEVVTAAEKADYPVLVIDSMSHEWEGQGGLLEEHDRLMGGNQSKNLQAWIKPKMAHRKFVNHVLQVKPHVIMCFRAAERVETERDGDGKLQIVPKKSPTGLDGWLPITEKNLPFEATASFLLMADRPGVPRPIKLPDPLRSLIPLDRPLDEASGAALAQWAAGASSDTDARVTELVQEINACAEQLGNRVAVNAAIAKNRRAHASNPGAHVEWLEATLAAARLKVAESEGSADDDPFAVLPPEEPTPAEATS